VFTARGLRGELRVGGQLAARLGRWELVRRGDTLGLDTARVDAEVTWSDPFWVTQQPMCVWLEMGPAWWVWPVVRVVGTKRVSMTVRGDPEVKEYKYEPFSKTEHR
jgi:hypothetical protein